jgi:hypothetical protein
VLTDPLVAPRVYGSGLAKLSGPLTVNLSLHGVNSVNGVNPGASRSH